MEKIHGIAHSTRIIKDCSLQKRYLRVHGRGQPARKARTKRSRPAPRFSRTLQRVKPILQATVLYWGMSMSCCQTQCSERGQTSRKSESAFAESPHSFKLDKDQLRGQAGSGVGLE